MNTPLKRKLFNAFMSLHILHHAQKEALYGSWMMEELKHHGYDVSYGTLYPLLHSLEKDGLLVSEEQIFEGKRRILYRTTPLGNESLLELQHYIRELTSEIHASK